MRVGVLVLLGAQQAPACLEVRRQVGIGVLDEAAGKRADALVVGAVGADRVDDGKPVLLAEPEVVLSERDRRVHEARPVLGADEVSRQHRVPALAVGLARDEPEGRLIRRALELLAGKPREDLRAVAEHALDESLGQHVDRPVVTGTDVCELGVDGDGGVRDQGPGSRGPDQQHVAGLQRTGRPGDTETHVQRRVDHVPVSERDLVRRQRSAAARAVGNDLVAQVEQVLSQICLRLHQTDSMYSLASVT